MSKESFLFVRKSTGLIREVSPIEAGIYNIAASGPLTIGLAYTISYWLSNYPKVNLPFAYVITIILTFFFSGAAALITSTMARTGGDYIFIGRSINPALGFLSSWNMFFYNTVTGQGAFVGYLTYFAIGPMLYTLGAMLNNPQLISIGEATLAFPWSVIIILTVLIVYGIIFLFGLKKSGKINSRHDGACLDLSIICDY